MDLTFKSTPSYQFESSWLYLVSLNYFYLKQSFYISFFKPAGDYFLATLLLVVLLPVMLLVILVNYLLNGHFLFIQNRPGLKGEIFRIYKLKTLVDHSIEGKDTPTKFGAFLRKASLDEIPQIINVLRGEMSFIGPRPLLEEYLPLYNCNHSKRHNLLPGITGLAQVNGRNTAPWQQRLDSDTQYVEQVSFTLDLKIILMSLTAITKTKEVNAVGHIGAEKFKGYYAKQ
jgi:lipopolysaccharide/colanic/teichoic acid biosynthesis glycosyltransferase